MKKITPKLLIIGAAVILAMVVALVLLLTLGKPAENPDNPDNPSVPDVPKETYYPLLEMELEDFASLTIFNQYGETKIVSEQSYLFSVPGVSAPIDMETVSMLVIYATDVQYTLLVAENPDDVEQYGLHEPEARFTVTDVNGQSHTFFVGNANPSKDKIYLQEEGKPSVYLVDGTYDDMKVVRPAALLSLELVPQIDVEDESALSTVSKIRIRSAKTGNRDVVLEYVDAESYEGTDASYYKYVMREPMSGVAVNAEYVEDYIFTALSGITAMSGVDMNPDEQEMETFGLNDPWGELELVIAGKSYDMLVSHEMYGGYCYVKIGDAVFFVPSSYFLCLNATVTALQTRFLFLDNISNFDAFTVRYDGKTYTFIPYGTMFDEKDPWGVRLNGKEMDGDEFKKLYTLMLSMFIEGMTSETDPVSTEDLVSVTYRYADTHEEVTIHYSTIDLRRCGVAYDGGDAVYYTMRKYVDKFITGLQNYLSGNLINLYE